METTLPNTEKQETTVAFKGRRWLFARLFVATILLIAAGMKAHQLATTPSLGEGLLHTRWFNIFVVEFELLFGIWLITGAFPKTSWLLATIVFIVFTSVSFLKGISGEVSCGCFGAATVNPWITSIFDLSIVALLIRYRPAGVSINLSDIIKESQLISRPWTAILRIVILWVFVAIPITYTMISIEKKDLSGLGIEFVGANNRKTILLDSTNWTGKKFPLTDYLESGKSIVKMKTGHWTVVMYHHDCSKCWAAIKRLSESDEKNVLCIEVPPFAKENNIPSSFEYARLNGNRHWFVETPTILKLDDLIVSESSSQ